MKKAALYARVSSQEQVLGTSMDSQRAELERWAEYKGYQQTLYLDEGLTGTTDKRKGLQSLITDAKAHRFEVVAVTKLDRFFRKLRPMLDYIHQLDELGIEFVSVGEGFDTSTNHGRFSLQMMGVIAEFERNRIVERTKEGRHATYRKGRWAAGNPLYGYHYNPDTKELEIKEDEATVVRRIFNSYVYDRLGVGRIARNLNEDGIKPRSHETKRRARQWYAGAVRDTISHTGYKGEHPLGIRMPAIIEPALWQLAQERRKDNRKLHRREGSPWLLQGLVKCGLCGHALACNWSHSTRRIYSCRGRLQLSKVIHDKCSLKPLDAEWLEEAVWDKVTDALSNPTSLMLALDDYISKLTEKSAELEKAIRPIEAELAEIAEKKRRLAEDWVVGSLPKDKANAIKANLDIEEIRLKSIKDEIDPAQLEELETTRYWLQFWAGRRHDLDLRLNLIMGNQTEKGQAAEVAKVITGMADIEDASLRDEVGSPATKRQLLDYLQCAVIPYPDRIEIKAFLPVNNIELQEYNPSYR
ncbi:MAG TPA: recombinase family protein [Dehalococcoidia bacterium]|nr:recombinase family protein [Dehalococcoidia bacterium]